MKKILTFFLTGAAIAALATACNDPKDPEGVDVPFTVYSSANETTGEEVSANWIARDYFFTPRGEGNAFIINRDEELQKYVMGDNCPSFDFSEKTLLLIGGGGAVRSPLTPSVRSFQYFPPDKYKLEIEVEQGIQMYGDVWCMAILIDKISNDSKIELSATIND